MIASDLRAVRGWLLCGSLALCMAAIDPVAAQDQAGPTPWRLAQAVTTTPLPTLEIGPPPNAKPPEKLQNQPGSAAPLRDPAEKQLQLRIDPQTGAPLTAGALKAREANEAGEATPAPESRRLQPRRLIVPRAQTERPAVEAAPKPKQEPTAEEIVIERLARPDPGSIGVLEVEGGGLGHDMWAGSERALVLRLLPALPVASRSATVRDLSRRLLLTTARAPQGLGDSTELLRQRVSLLWAAGWAGDATALLRVVPPVAEHPALDAIRLDIQLAAGRHEDACTLARNMRERQATPALKKAAAFCLAMAGRTAQLDLYEQVLYADGIEDPAFFRLLAQLAGREPVEPVDLPSSAMSPLYLAMLQATDRPPPDAALDGGSAAALRGLALAPGAQPHLRAEAAELAAERGILTLDELRQLYLSLPIAAASEADPIAFAAEEPGALAAAALYRAIANSQNVEATLNLIEETWRHARARGRSDVVARALRPHIEAVQPVEVLAVYAAVTMRVLLRGGAMEAARGWFQELIRPARLGDPHAASAVLELAPLIYAADAGEQVAAPAQALSIWWRAQNDAAGGHSPAERALVLAMLESLERPMPDALWADAIGPAPMAVGPLPSVAMARQFEQAVAAGRKGETVLLALILLGNDGPQAVADTVLARIVSGLKRIGLNREAHALALESLLIRGF